MLSFALGRGEIRRAMSSESPTSQPIQSRRAAREAALKAAYQIRIGGAHVDEALTDALENANFAPAAANFIEQLLRGVDDHIDQIDNMIKPLLAKGWDFERLAETDRAILRIATFELFFIPEIPPKATINEAVILAKRYGTEDSGRFVNGLLGKLLEQSPKASWTPPESPDWDEPDTETESEPEVEIVEEGSEQHAAISGKWKLRKKEVE